MSAVEITDTDRGYAALVARVRELKGARIEVGILGGDAQKPKKGHDGEEEPATLLDVGIFNEFGTEDIPERSFLRAYFDEHQDELEEKASSLLKRVVAGQMTKQAALEQLGLYAVGEIQKRIAAGIEPENAESTVRRKGSSTPLEDTGQLRQNISHRALLGGE